MLLDQMKLEGSADTARALANGVRALDGEYRQFRLRVAAAAGLSVAEFDALTAITWAAEDVTPKRLATTIHMTTGAVTAMLDRLSAASLVQRLPHPTDRRSVFLTLTLAGEELVGRVYRSYVRAFEPLVAGATEAEVQGLVEALGRFAAAVRHADDDFRPDQQDGLAGDSG